MYANEVRHSLLLPYFHSANMIDRSTLTERHALYNDGSTESLRKVHHRHSRVIVWWFDILWGVSIAARQSIIHHNTSWDWYAKIHRMKQKACENERKTWKKMHSIQKQIMTACKYWSQHKVYLCSWLKECR
jgi:hypothetical protein